MRVLEAVYVICMRRTTLAIQSHLCGFSVINCCKKKLVLYNYKELQKEKCYNIQARIKIFRIINHEGKILWQIEITLICGNAK